ncbi:MAG: asparaginase [Synergistaceae bacterium]|jgi:L-asparaginase|nr:asparaginase [Synergistaceae bacterium]
MRIRVISTGGTILSCHGEKGLVPARGAVETVDILSSRFPGHDFSVETLMSIDSANMQPEQWGEIAAASYGALAEDDGVIILHGTDTMAYTSSAVGFMLRGIRKPVTLTGSQIPAENPFSDAPSNFATAVSAVLNGITGVTVSFGNKIINGVRATKLSTSDIDAFGSVNVPPVAEMTGLGMKRLGRGTSAASDTPLALGKLEKDICPDVFLLKLAPGTRPEIFEALLRMGYRGIVVESFGMGGIPYIGRNLAEGVSLAVRNGTPVAVCSQCPWGTVDLSVYETGGRMLDAGAFSAGDMSTEAAVTKLMWALGKTSNLGEIGKIFRTNLAGEITLD